MHDWLSHFFIRKTRTQTYSTVRYAFPVVIIAALFVGFASVVTENSSFVTVRTDKSTLQKDEQFYIEVLVTAHTPVNAVDLVLSYPTDKIEVEGIDTGTSVITLWTEEPYAKDGNIYLRGGTFRRDSWVNIPLRV
jgi:hypothetical protein